MFTRFNELGHTFALMDELRRRMERSFETPDPYAAMFGEQWSEGAPRAALYDAGNELVLKTELPGVAEKSLNLSLHEDVLTLSGERSVRAPEGYAAHRQERGTMKFSRSFALQHRIDAERTTAQLENGVLTVTLPKHPDEKPRQISVRAG